MPGVCSLGLHVVGNETCHLVTWRLCTEAGVKNCSLQERKDSFKLGKGVMGQLPFLQIKEYPEEVNYKKAS